MKELLHAFFMCQSMFCAVPCPVSIWDENARDKLLWCLPLVGLEIGVLWWGSAWLLYWLHLPQALSAGLLCVLPFWATGGMHLDGFMDVTDAVGSCRDLSRRREILKDSHVGSFAVIGFGILLLLQFSACFSLAGKSLAGLVLIPVVSRCCSAVAVSVLPKMTTSQYARQNSRRADWLIPVLTCLAAMLLGFIWDVSTLVVLLACLAGYGIALRHAYRSLQGMNGDISGYALTISELVALMAMTLL